MKGINSVVRISMKLLLGLVTVVRKIFLIKNMKEGLVNSADCCH